MPTLEPTAVPTLEPTLEPTAMPTLEPSSLPSLAPTSPPTLEPTALPTLEPTSEPTALPTLEPTVLPSLSPHRLTLAPSSPPASAQPCCRPPAQRDSDARAYPTAVHSSNRCPDGPAVAGADGVADNRTDSPADRDANSGPVAGADNCPPHRDEGQPHADADARGAGRRGAQRSHVGRTGGQVLHDFQPAVEADAFCAVECVRQQPQPRVVVRGRAADVRRHDGDHSSRKLFGDESRVRFKRRGHVDIGEAIRFRFQATNSLNDMYDFDTITVKAGTPPTNGNLTVAPVNGFRVHEVQFDDQSDLAKRRWA